MTDRFVLFTRLRLQNYKLHANTEIDLAERPILLITGANGSGKTQVLEALRLCLGVHPAPSRARGMVSVIGPCGDDARLALDVRNPVVNEHRLLKPPDEELAKALDHDVIRIATRVTRSGSVRYRVGSAQAEAPTARVSGRQLRDALRSANIQAANRLAFTEEGVVDVFAGESGRKKLESLLEATGRLQYLEDLRQALIHLDDAARQTDPLRQKLKWERDLVASIRERLEIIRERSKYIEQHAALCIEHAWAIVRDLEVARDALAARTARAQARLERCSASLQVAEDTLARTQAAIDERTREATETRAAITREKATLERLVGHRLRLQQNLAEATNDLGRLGAERDELAAIVSSERGRTDTARLQQLQQELAQAEHEMAGLLLEIESLGAATGEEADPETPRSSRAPSMTRFELEMIEGCVVFQQAVAERRMGRAIIGPVLSMVSVRSGEEAWEPAVRCLAGRHLFAFIARDRGTYAQAKALFDEIFPRRKPPIIVARHSDNVPKREAPAPPRAVHALALDLVDGDPQCLSFLARVLRGAVAETGADANALTDFAEQAGRPVLSADCQSYYAPFGGFTRPPAPIVTSLGTPLIARGGKSEGSKALDAQRAEARQRELLRRHAAMAVRARRLDDETRKLGVKPRVVERLRNVEERVATLHARIAQMTDENTRLLGQIKVLQEVINEMVAGEKPLGTDIDELQAHLRNAQAERVRCTTLIAEEHKVLQRFRDEMAGLGTQLAAADQDAAALGRRPPEVRITALVAREKSEVKGKLDAIVGQTVDEDNLRRKEEELESLETYVAERTMHIERLQADVGGRREIWQREVRAMVEHLSRVMQALLRGGAFRDVRLEVAHVEDPEKAELAIRARTKGAQWLDYRELSGGEKVLCTEALIMSLHTMSDSPVHAIDEFTQRLDKSNAAAAFDIVRKTFEMTSSTQARLLPQFVLLCPEAFGLEDNELIRHIVLVEARLRGSRRGRKQP